MALPKIGFGPLQTLFTASLSQTLQTDLHLLAQFAELSLVIGCPRLLTEQAAVSMNLRLAQHQADREGPALCHLVAQLGMLSHAAGGVVPAAKALQGLLLKAPRHKGPCEVCDETPGLRETACKTLISL